MFCIHDLPLKRSPDSQILYSLFYRVVLLKTDGVVSNQSLRLSISLHVSPNAREGWSTLKARRWPQASVEGWSP